MSNRHLFAAATMGQAAKAIDKTAGVIFGAAINTIGPALGHGVQLDREFIQGVEVLGNEQGRHGIKVRYGHPTMCGNALLDAPYIGRVKNFEIDGDIVRGDIYLSASAKDTPAGNLFDRVLSLAENDADMFGMSIVFTPGDQYKLDADGEKVFSGDAGFAEIEGEPFATIDKLHGADVVDQPAANAGLFGGINAAEFASTVTDFLANNERIWDLIKENPEVVNQFIARYSAMQQINTEGANNMPTIEPVEDAVIVATDAVITETFTAEPAEVVTVTEQQAEFKALYDAYGGAFAEYAHTEKLTDSEARDAYIAHLQDRVADLEAQLSAAHDIGETVPAEFSACPTAPADAESDRAEKRFAELVKSGMKPGAARFAASLKINK